MNDTRRAVLVSEADILPEIPGERRVFRLAAVSRMLDAYDAAAHQPRTLYCETHKSPVARLTHPEAWMHLEQQAEYGIDQCGIVSAIVVPLPEDAA